MDGLVTHLPGHEHTVHKVRDAEDGKGRSNGHDSICDDLSGCGYKERNVSTRW